MRDSALEYVHEGERVPVRKLPGFIVVGAAVLLATSVGAVPAQAAATQTVTIHLSSSSVTVPGSVTISGSVTHAARGQQLRLQRFTGGAWHPYKWVSLDAHSGYRFTVQPGGPGVFTYRTASPHDVSQSVAVTASAWMYLSDVPLYGSNGNGGCSGAQTINGNTYIHSCFFGSTYNGAEDVEWNLERRCSTFRGTIGPSDTDADTTNVNVSVTVDNGIERYNHTYLLGQSTAPSIDIQGQLRLKFTAFGFDTMFDGFSYTEAIGLGNAQILCSSQLATTN